MTKSKYIAGAGGGGGGKGGGGGGHTPTEADDSLQSKQFANVLDLISEGEIQGLDDGNKSIFLTALLCKHQTAHTIFLTIQSALAMARKHRPIFPAFLAMLSLRHKLVLRLLKPRQ